jgi:hypothetical protein
MEVLDLYDAADSAIRDAILHTDMRPDFRGDHLGAKPDGDRLNFTDRGPWMGFLGLIVQNYHSDSRVAPKRTKSPSRLAGFQNKHLWKLRDAMVLHTQLVSVDG